MEGLDGDDVAVLPPHDDDEADQEVLQQDGGGMLVPNEMNDNPIVLDAGAGHQEDGREREWNEMVENIKYIREHFIEKIETPKPKTFWEVLLSAGKTFSYLYLVGFVVFVIAWMYVDNFNAYIPWPGHQIVIVVRLFLASLIIWNFTSFESNKKMFWFCCGFAQKIDGVLSLLVDKLLPFPLNEIFKWIRLISYFSIISAGAAFGAYLYAYNIHPLIPAQFHGIISYFFFSCLWLVRFTFSTCATWFISCISEWSIYKFLVNYLVHPIERVSHFFAEIQAFVLALPKIMKFFTTYPDLPNPFQNVFSSWIDARNAVSNSSSDLLHKLGDMIPQPQAPTWPNIRIPAVDVAFYCAVNGSSLCFWPSSSSNSTNTTDDKSSWNFWSPPSTNSNGTNDIDASSKSWLNVNYLWPSPSPSNINTTIITTTTNTSIAANEAKNTNTPTPTYMTYFSWNPSPAPVPPATPLPPAAATDAAQEKKSKEEL